MAPQDDQQHTPHADASQRSDPQSGYEILGQDARQETRMLRDNEALTAETAQLIRERAAAYIADRREKDKRFSIEKFARELGAVTTGRGERKRVHHTVLSQVLAGNYQGTIEPYIRRIDEFLSRERLASDRLGTDEYCDIQLAQKVRGIVNTTKRQQSIGAVIMRPGQGKTTIARACKRLDSAAVMITIKEREGDVYGVADALYRALEIAGTGCVPNRIRAVAEHLRNDRTVIVLVDECQKLSARGLEYLRDLHDNAEGGQPIPMVLFGDHDFFKLVQQGRGGRGRVRPQLARRIFPVFDSDSAGTFRGRPRGRTKDLFGEEDLVRILRNDKLKLVTDDGIGWLASLANLKDFGALGTALAVCRLAYDIARGEMLDVDHLQRALRMMFTANVAGLIIARIDHPVQEEEERVAAAG